MAFDTDNARVNATLKLGVLDRLDLRLHFAEDLSPEVGVGRLGFQSKAAIVPLGDDQLGLAVSALNDLPLADTDPHLFGALLILSYPFGGFQIDADLGVHVSLARAAGEADVLTPQAAACLGFPIVAALGGFVETYLLLPCTEGESCRMGRVGAGVGLSYTVAANLILDTSLDLGLDGSDPEWTVQIGLTAAVALWR